MANIFLGFLIILQITSQLTSIEMKIIFKNHSDALNDFSITHNKIKNTENKNSLQIKQSDESLTEFMKKLKKFLRKFEFIQSLNASKVETSANVMFSKGDKNEEFSNRRSKLNSEIVNVEYWYRKSRKYDALKSSNIYIIKTFIRAILSAGHSMSDILLHIFQLIFFDITEFTGDNFFVSYNKHIKENYVNTCDSGISPQQRIFNIILLLIQTEIRGFITISQAHLLKSSLNRDDYNDEYKYSKNDSIARLNQYFNESTGELSKFARHIYRCDLQFPKIGDNVLQLEGLFQVVIHGEVALKKRVQNKFVPARGSCEDIKSDRREQFVINYCTTSKAISGCPVINSNGALRLSWWKSNSKNYGHVYECPKKLYKLEGNYAGWYYNDVCVCSVNFTDEPYRTYHLDQWNMNFTMPKIVKISTQHQLSDIANNMIVTGVQFILHNDAIHLQIKQSKLSFGAQITATGSWKPVDIDNKNEKIKIQYKSVYDRRNIIHLDDVGIDPGHVVTGVQFQVTKEGNGFELHVHSTKYDYNTGQLNNEGKWNKPGENPINQADYKRKRIEIKLNNPDNPVFGKNYYPDPTSNKFVQFQHSSIVKDAGYHTVPFFEAQPVKTTPEYPLSGIGIFHKGLDGFGGYIAPRLFTYDMTSALNSVFNEWKSLLNYRNISVGTFGDGTDISNEIDTILI